jgi:putative ABC transport system permease protein
VTLRRRVARLRALVTATRLDRELNDEIAAHLELAERDARARGLDPAAARREALAAFGGIDQVREIHRDDRSVRWIENAFRDVRYAIAGLRREPAFACIAIGVLALGIGANTAVFSIVDGTLLKPLPFPDPERLVRMWETPSATTTNSTTALNFTELNRRLRTFEAFSGEADVNATAELNGEPTRLAGRIVSANHFDVFGIAPFIGRTFRSDEDRPGANHVIVLSHAAWQQYFGADPSILSRDVRLDGVLHRVVGVMPAGVLDRDRRFARMDVVSFWKPLGLTPEQLAAGSHWLNPVGRLRKGVSLNEAQRDMLDARAAIADLIPAWKKNWSVRVEPFDAALVDEQLRRSLFVALGAVVLVLLITCANLTNLLLSRGVARQKEIAVRTAIGATRARLVSQLLIESLVLALAGGAAGVALAALLLRVAMPLLPVDVPFTAEIMLNARVLAFALIVAVAASALIGVLPALRLSSGSAAAALRAATRGASTGHAGVRRLIVGAEVAMTIVLLCGSVLLFKSLMHLQHVDIGARIANVVSASIDIARDSYPTPEQAAAFYRRFVDRVRAVPGVEAAAMAGDVPLEGTGGEFLRLPGRSDERLNVRFKRAGDGYFETIGVPVVAGRTFTDHDRIGAPWVTVINEELAAQLRSTFNIADPVGRLVDLPAIGYGSPTVRQSMTVIGIVKNEKVQGDLRAAMDPIAYVPLAQAPLLWTKLALRTAGSPSAIIPAVREALRQVDPNVALAQVRTLEELRALSLSGMLEPAWLIGIFAMLSALLAALGLYGVVSHSVTHQRREIGIRMALGAGSRSVISLVVRHVLTTIVFGSIAGLAAAVAATRVMRTLLFGVSALDPAAFITAAVVMALVGVTAALIPATRATRVDPTTALRQE